MSKHETQSSNRFSFAIAMALAVTVTVVVAALVEAVAGMEAFI
jgi:hypothetical protein